jgi:molybdopterin converting factor small subunit
MEMKTDIHISLRLFASLAQRMPEHPDRFAVPPGATVGDVLSVLDIAADDAKLVFINNRRAELTSALADGDRLGIFPPVGGG